MTLIMLIKVALFSLALCIAQFSYVAAVPRSQVSQRIIGGSATTISQYPAIAALLYSNDLTTYWQTCGGSILNSRSILTAASSLHGDTTDKWRVRVGSTYANSGGTVYGTASFIIHPNYDSWTYENDIAILRTATSITYVNNAVQAALIAGPNYAPGDNELVWAAGWGVTAIDGSASEQLQHVQIWTINQVTCRSRYTSLGWPITDSMLCSGWLDVGGRGQCQGDSGGPLYHNNVVIGVTSWSYRCAQAYYPDVNTRVASYSIWIQENA